MLLWSSSFGSLFEWVGPAFSGIVDVLDRCSLPFLVGGEAFAYSLGDYLKSPVVATHTAYVFFLKMPSFLIWTLPICLGLRWAQEPYSAACMQLLLVCDRAASDTSDVAVSLPRRVVALLASLLLVAATCCTLTLAISMLSRPHGEWFVA
eukprot:TRINITY_DN41708_c0_g2_i3.p1 TRINITY_DN41708_c0_g2~~TRINITY_DN41708_c0_g2_i3.p1  ORF type:complete len:150 (+),score=18.05 TRINITY_DN41708_c0_g2_i3:49-498(+)